MNDQPLLVLDLDETLIHGREIPLGRDPDFEVDPYFIYLRPGVFEFIRAVATRYRLAVWTSSSPAYARDVCAEIFTDATQLEFLWASDRCTPTRIFELDTWCNAKPLKKLKRLGYDLSRVLAVDDSPEKHRRNYGNLVQVAPYTGEPDDDELAHLSKYLLNLFGEKDFRIVEKKGWRKK